MWYLLYVSTVVSSWASVGIMSEGPFESEKACFIAAKDSWKKSDGWIMQSKGSVDHRTNFYNSKYRIYYLDNKEAKMGLYYTCVEPRKVGEG